MRKHQNSDCFEAGLGELEPTNEAKRTALISYKNEPSKKTLAALKKATNDARQIT